MMYAQPFKERACQLAKGHLILRTAAGEPCAMASQAAGKYKLVTPASDCLLCPVCLDVSSDPWQHDKCGKVFCRKCLEQYGKDQPCPHCREKQPQYFEDTKSEYCMHETFFHVTKKTGLFNHHCPQANRQLLCSRLS